MRAGISEARAAVASASAAPSGDRILPLLAFATDGWATKNDLESDLVGALAACGKKAKAPLFVTLQKDWELHRVATAIRALGRIGGADVMKRVFALADSPLPDDLWSALADAAKASGVAVPKAAVASRKAMNAAVSPRERRTFYEQRRAAWEKAQPAKPAPKKPAKPRSAKLPRAFSIERETSRLIAATKASIARTYSPTRMKVLFDVTTLAWWLEALGRSDEALEVASFSRTRSRRRTTTTSGRR